jgi:diaminopimelate epimerase
MCGNGIRLFARYLVDSHLEPPGEIRIATRDGVKRVHLSTLGGVTVEMGPATFPGPEEVKVVAGGRTWEGVSVDVGNPHVVAFVNDVADAGDLASAPVTEPAFSEGVNVEFVAEVGERHIAMRVHERGVGETRSCGTGACAAAVAAARKAGEDGATTYTVDVPGGSLTVSREADGEIQLTGPAVVVAEGALSDEWLEAHR